MYCYLLAKDFEREKYYSMAPIDIEWTYCGQTITGMVAAQPLFFHDCRCKKGVSVTNTTRT